MTENIINDFKKVIKDIIHNYDIIIISDYNKGFLTEEDIEWITKHHDCVFIDTKRHKFFFHEIESVHWSDASPKGQEVAGGH